MDNEFEIDVRQVLLDLAKDAPEEYKKRIMDFISSLDERKKSLEQ